MSTTQKNGQGVPGTTLPKFDRKQFHEILDRDLKFLLSLAHFIRDNPRMTQVMVEEMMRIQENTPVIKDEDFHPELKSDV